MKNMDTFHEDEPTTVTLSLDDGSELECSVIAIFPAGEHEYIALLPIEDTETEDAEVLLYRYEEDDEGNPDLSNIEDDDEYEIAADAFDELLDSEDFEYEDEDFIDDEDQE